MNTYGDEKYASCRLRDIVHVGVERACKKTHFFHGALHNWTAAVFPSLYLSLCVLRLHRVSGSYLVSVYTIRQDFEFHSSFDGVAYLSYMDHHRLFFVP